MGNQLSFVLGMAAGGFDRAVQTSQQKLGSFLGTAAKIAGITALSEAMLQSLKQTANAVAGIGDAFQRGADLQRLHNRTGQSVQDLFLLQKGFAAVGLQGDAAGEMIFHLQKSLTGLSEVGEDTSVAFSILGLNMQKLRGEGSARAITEIAKAFQQLDPNQAAGFASKLFGRGEAGNFLQLARDSEAFTKALHDNAAAAEQMARDAAQFNRIELDLTKLKNKSKNLFAGIAEGIAPAVEKILDMVNKIDLSGIGKNLGTALSGIIGAFQQGKLTDLIYLAIYTGFEMAVAAVPALFVKLGDMLLHVFKTPLNYIQASMEYLIQHLMADITMLHLNKVFGVPEMKPGDMQTWKQVLADQDKDGPQFNVGFGQYGMTDIDKSTKDIWNEAMAKIASLGGAFMTEVQKTAAPQNKLPANSTAATQMFAGKVSGFESTTFEKIGGMLSGGNAPSLLSDHARRTAAATERTAAGVATLVQIAQGDPSKGILNSNAP